MRVAILGGGAFGTSWAKMLVERGHEVMLWVRSEQAARQIVETRESSHLPGFRLGPCVAVTHELRVALEGRPLVLGVAPSQVTRQVMTAAAPFVHPDAVVVSASKGIELDTLATIDRIYQDVLPAPIAARAAFLSGPTFAKELAQGLPAGIVVASHDPASAALVQRELATDRLRVYSTEDVIGVELGGALKNVIAIAAGISDGLGFGHNTRAMLITRGLSEIARLGVKMGANPLTFAGLAGMGDLVLTCTGDLSRNRQVGLELGRGRTLDEIISGMNAVAEGVKTTRSAHALARKLGVEMPLCAGVHAILYEGRDARQVVGELMRRDPKPERA